MQQNSIYVYLGLIIAGLSFGAVPTISAILRDSNVSSIEQSFIRLLIGGIAGFFLILFYSKNNIESFRKSITTSIQKTYIVQGIIISLSLNFYLASIALGTPAGEAALLLQIQPLVAIILGFTLLKESITKSKIISLSLALCGIFTLIKPWEWTSFLSSLGGSLLAIISGVTYGVYIVFGKLYSTKREKLPFSLSLAWVLLWAFIMWIPIFIITRITPFPSEIISFDLSTYLIFKNIVFGLGLGIIGNVIPFGLIMLTVNYIESSKASIILLIEPLGAILLAAFVLNEAITIWYVIGGFFLLLAILMIFTLSKTAKIEKDPEISLN